MDNSKVCGSCKFWLPQCPEGKVDPRKSKYSSEMGWCRHAQAGRIPIDGKSAREIVVAHTPESKPYVAIHTDVLSTCQAHSPKNFVQHTDD